MQLTKTIRKDLDIKTEPSEQFKSLCSKYGVDIHNIDFETLMQNRKDYDSDKSFLDNEVTPLLKTLSELDKMELVSLEQPSKKGLEALEGEQNQRELLEQQQKVEQDYQRVLEAIKTNPTPNIDKITYKIERWLNLVLNEQNETHTLIISGRAGVSKTHIITKVLKRKFGVEKLSKIKMGGHKTPLDYYCALYDNPDGIFYWNDLNKSFFANSTGISLLKQSTDTYKERKVDYGSTSAKLGNRAGSCIFRGKQIFDMNSFPRNEEFETIVSRSPPIRFNPTNKEILIMCYEIIKEDFMDVPLKDKINIVEFLERNVTEATKNFDLRKLKWVIDVYRECKGINEEFKSMASDLLEVDKAKEKVLELSKSLMNVKEQEKEYIKYSQENELACSRATFYNHRKIMGLGI